MSETLTRKERMRAQTRADIMAATRELLAEGGISALRISDITDRTDIALGSFYSHFGSKDEVVEAVVEESVRALADGILEASRHLDDPAEAMSVGIRIVVGLCYSNPEVAGLLINLDHPQEQFETMAREQALAVIESGVAAGRFTTDDAELVLTIATGSVLAAIRNTLAGRHGPDTDIACAALLLRAVGIERAEAEEIARRPLPSLENLDGSG